MRGQEAMPSMALQFQPGQTIRFVYRNWRGVVATRTAQIISLSYGVTEWHPEPQWLLQALDLEKNAVRLFALRDMTPAAGAARLGRNQ
jgi:hypothetical protein